MFGSPSRHLGVLCLQSQILLLHYFQLGVLPLSPYLMMWPLGLLISLVPCGVFELFETIWPSLRRNSTLTHAFFLLDLHWLGGSKSNRYIYPSPFLMFQIVLAAMLATLLLSLSIHILKLVVLTLFGLPSILNPWDSILMYLYFPLNLPQTLVASSEPTWIYLLR